MQKDKRALMKNIISSVEDRNLTDREKIKQKFAEPLRSEGSTTENRLMSSSADENLDEEHDKPITQDQMDATR